MNPAWLALIIILLTAWPTLGRSDATVFIYHRFGEPTLPSTNIRMAQFRAQLDYLQQQRFQFWSLSRLEDALRKQQPIPDKTVVITIDDAYLSVYQQAFPELRSRNIPFAVFVATDYVDRRYPNYMNWSQLREMRDAGVEFAPHTASHDHLTERRDNETASQWRQRIRTDLLHSQQQLQQQLGIRSSVFAYPYGEYSEELKQIIKELGWIAFGQHSGTINLHSDILALPRFPQSEFYGDLPQFIDKANSLAMPIRKLHPADPLRQNHQAPKLRVELSQSLPRAAQIRCFGEGNMRVRWIKPNVEFEVSTDQPLSGRRSRYNCTIPSDQPGRYFWFSQPWIIAGQAED